MGLAGPAHRTRGTNRYAYSGGKSRSIGRLVAHLCGRYNSTTDMLRVLIAQRKGSFFCQTALNRGALFPFLSLFPLPDIAPLSSSVLLVEAPPILQGPAWLTPPLYQITIVKHDFPLPWTPMALGSKSSYRNIDWYFRYPCACCIYSTRL